MSNEKKEIICPIKDADGNTCEEAKAKAEGGTFPLGSRNKTWHAGLHFATESPIVAVADGHVVAFRFDNADALGVSATDGYSNSFVLIKHNWNTPLGNQLSYYSLYMHLDPRPSGDYLPDFIKNKGKGTNGKDDPPPGVMLFEGTKEKPTDTSKVLIPFKSLIEKKSEKFKHGKSEYMLVSYTSCDGETHEGVIRFSADILLEKDGSHYIGLHHHKYYHGGNAAKRWTGCKKKDGTPIKGVLIRKEANDKSEVVGFIPNTDKLQIKLKKEEGSVASDWRELESPLPKTYFSGPFYVNQKDLKEIPGEDIDKSKLNELQIPAPSERPWVESGSVVGKTTKQRGIRHKFFHHEIFTLTNLLKKDSFLNDPPGERYLSEKTQYVVPAGRKKLPGIVDLELRKGDYIRIVDNPPQSTFVRVQVTGIIRTVPHAWLQDAVPDTKIVCTYLNNEPLYHYIPKDTEYRQLNHALNGWLKPEDTLYRKGGSGGNRDVYLHSEGRANTQVWLPKICLEHYGNEIQRLTENPEAIFSEDPSKNAPEEIDHVELKKGDFIKVLERSEKTDYVKIQVTAIVRKVKYNTLKHEKTKACTYQKGEVKDYYIPVDNASRFAEINSKLYGWLEKGKELFLVYKKPGQSWRKVLLPCGYQENARFWIRKDYLDTMKVPESEALKDELELDKDIDELYFKEPIETDEVVTEEEIVLKSPTLFTYNDTKYGVMDDGWGVDISDIEPKSPFTWPGFELMYEDEDPPSEDAFVNLDKLKTVTPLLEVTGTAEELRKAIAGDLYSQVPKLNGNRDWYERLCRLIVRSPSEWYYNKKRWERLGKIVGTISHELEEWIGKLSFWDELAEGGVFKDEPDSGKSGVEVFAFHPQQFLAQLHEMETCFISVERKEDIMALVRMVRYIAGEKWSTEETCKAVAAALHYRIGKYEWHSCNNFLQLEHRFCKEYEIPPEKGLLAPSDKEVATMMPWIADVASKKKWSKLPNDYVLFHSTDETLESQPWDTTVLKGNAVKSVGGINFYKYSELRPMNYATELTVKKIKLVGGGAEGISGHPLSGDDKRPYLYDIKKPAKWDLEFSFNITEGTSAQEEEKKTISWELKYLTVVDHELEYSTLDVSMQGNRISVTIPGEAARYHVQLIPYTVKDTRGELCRPFEIVLKRDHQFRFDGNTIRLQDETGKALDLVPTAGEIGKPIKTLAAFSGSSDLLPPTGQEIKNGPIPEGMWWVEDWNLESFNSCPTERENVDDDWPFDVDPRGKWPAAGKEWDFQYCTTNASEEWDTTRIWLVPHEKTETKGRSNLCILGSNEKNTGGNIHIYNSKTPYNDMGVLLW